MSYFEHFFDNIDDDKFINHNTTDETLSLIYQVRRGIHTMPSVNHALAQLINKKLGDKEYSDDEIKSHIAYACISVKKGERDEIFRQISNMRKK